MIEAMAQAERLISGTIIKELVLAARHGLDFANRELRSAGVDPGEYGPLSFVGVMQPVTRTLLAREMGLRRTTLRDLVGRLIERGHVREDPNPGDGRSTLLRLTPAGQEIFDRGIPVFQRVLREIDASLGGRLKEEELAVRRVRIALQALSAD
jgi:DNA-binding MarR family transcriptional regulator